MFQLTAPLTKIKETMTALSALQKTIAQANNGLKLSFSILETQVSQQSQTCDLAALINEARTRAQKLAGTAGLGAGRIVGIAGSISNSVPICSLGVEFALGGMIGQPGPYSLTISSTRTTTALVDQAVIGIDVTSGLTVGLDDITAALTGSGITGATFAGEDNTTVDVGDNAQDGLDWSFTLTVPLARLKDDLATVNAAQQTIGKQNSGLAFSFYIEGTQASDQAQQSQPCPESDLMAEARTQAQKVAAAAGVIAGPILTISDTGEPAVVYAGPYRFSPELTQILTTPTPSCGLTVQFQLQ
jgi:uncharacterized protein YggE